MPKITIIGAGSLGFARRLIMDVLSYDELKETEFSLMDIDEKRLDYTKRIALKMIKDNKLPAKVSVTTDRKKALAGADYVIIAILANGTKPIWLEMEIPMKYGVDQCIGDTLGPGGVFRALRTIPIMVSIAKDIETFCPRAWVLNYTNPMAMLCWSMFKSTKINLVGLCHSVQGTVKNLAKYTDVPLTEIRWFVAGINHQSWVLKFERNNGESLYPLLRERIKNPEIYSNDIVRFEMFKHLDYFVTESSGHNSEYNWWFRKRKDLIEKYMTHSKNVWKGTQAYIKVLYGTNRVDFEKKLEAIASSPDPIKLTRSVEYGSYIIHSLHTDTPRQINGNVRNTGLITNLPDDCSVEVPCLVNKSGIHPCYVGELPAHLAAINRSNVAVQQLAVESALTGDKRKTFHAIALDPLTAAVLSLEEVNSMVNEMLDAEKQWLPQFK